MTEMRVKYLQTKIAYLIPPKQRSKSRYLNINEIAKWCSKVLNYYDKNKDARNEICKKIEWIIEYRDFVLELNELNELVCKIEKKLKYNGFSNESLKYCNDLLEKIDSVFCKEMKTQLKIYFKDLQEKNINAEKLLITSDIIESSFGKYKNYVSQNPMAGITNLILSISAFTSTLNEEDIKEALENTNIYDVKDWTKKNIGKTLFQERKEAFVF
jgi:hypothetical protein